MGGARLSITSDIWYIYAGFEFARYMSSALFFTAISGTIPCSTCRATCSFSTHRLRIVSRTSEPIFSFAIIIIITITISTVTTVTAFIIATDAVIITRCYTCCGREIFSSITCHRHNLIWSTIRKIPS